MGKRGGTKVSLPGLDSRVGEKVVVGQFEKHIPPAAEAAIGLSTYGAAEAAPFQNRLKLTHYRKSRRAVELAEATLEVILKKSRSIDNCAIW